MKEQEQEMKFSDEDLIVLQDEDGKEIEFVHIATIDYQDEWYAFLQPVELEGMEEDEMIIFKLQEDEEGNDMFVPVDDEELMNAVYDEYVKEAGCECDCEDCDGECDHDHDCHCDECKHK